LTYVGTEDQRVVTTAHGGAVAFRIVQLDGPFATEVVRRSSCESHTYAQGEIETIPFARSGSFGAQSDDADFWRAWFGDPELRLTPGTYRIVAVAEYGPRGCADTTKLEAAVTIEVVATADATPEASASPSDAEPSVQQWTSTGIKTRPTSRRS
jgi:hypothetical protein